MTFVNLVVTSNNRDETGCPIILIFGFPILTYGIIYASPTISDIDKDGKNEIIIANYDRSVYVYETKGGNIEWGCIKHDRWHTGLYGFVPTDTFSIAETPPSLPISYKLLQNYPNPFSHKTVISYWLMRIK